MAAKKEQHLKVLIAKKEQYFARIQRIYDNSRDVSTPEKISNFRVRYETFETTKNKFLDILDEINVVQCELDENFVPNYNILEAFDDLICRIESVAKNIITNNSSNSNIAQAQQHSGRSCFIRKLPELPLPKFSGDVKEWPLFIECYNSMIHNNRELNDIDRVHYLIGCLSGSALSVCSGIAPTGDNYGIVLKALTDKYEDKRIIANSLLEQLFNFKAAQNENAHTLNLFLEKFDSAVTSLRKLNIPDLADYLLSYLAFQKLNPETQRLFENTRRKSEMPSYLDIITFVKEQAKICTRTCNINRLASSSNKNSPVHNTNKFSPVHSSNKNSPVNNSNSWTNTKAQLSHSFVVQNSNGFKCVICRNNSHSISSCSKFLELSPEERYKVVRSNNLCLNCLSLHKIIHCKSNGTCRICHIKHHTLLHFKSPYKSTVNNTEPSDSGPSTSSEDPIVSASSSNSNSSNDAGSGSTNISLANCCSVTSTSTSSDYTVLLATAKVYVLDGFGNRHNARFLLDSGSQANFLSLAFSRRLKLQLSMSCSEVHGLGSSRSSVNGCANIVIISQLNSNKRYSLEVLVVEKITDDLPPVRINRKELAHLDSLPLADSGFSLPRNIDGIIGANLFAHLLGEKRVIGPPNTPIAIETTLGYVVMGSVPILAPWVPTHSFLLTSDDNPLEKLVKKFWEVEDIPQSTSSDPDDLECEDIFNSTVRRDSVGRYTVALPFKINCSYLGDSYNTALRRFLALEIKLHNHPDLRRQYTQIIDDYLLQGHMTKVVDSCSLESPHYFIPHHAVFKNESTTTPVRIVFDASCKTDTMYSLNDLLYTGPKLQSDICSMFLNFRLFPVALSADIRQMYRQINLQENHRKFQRILWRFSPNDPIEIYQLNTVTFGVKTSPFLALRTIRQLADDEKSSFPLASEVVKRDMYVDDLVSSLSSSSLAIVLYHQLVEMFQKGGFQLAKWATNSKELLEEIPVDRRTNNVVNFDTDTLKVLGLQWHPNSDLLSFSFDFIDKPCTKRNILSTVARCYDPLGFLSPVTLLAKILVKDCWILHLDWDDLCPPDIVQRWDTYKIGLHLLLNFNVPRHIGVQLNESVVLVGFADACLTSYGAVVYLRSIDSSGSIHTHLLCAKTKVSPMKVVSIPRLELCAAHLLAKLLRFIVDCYQSRVKIIRTFALSDSTITLNWIASHPSKLQTFVSNRVAQIQSLTDSNSWYHVSGKNNISDCLSRGLTPSQFMSHTSWKVGPEWLKLGFSEWPISTVRLEENLPELKVISLVVAAENIENNPFHALIMRNSKWIKLVRTVVYILRLVKILPRSSSISPRDLEVAEITLIKQVQHRHFQDEINLLSKDIVPKSLRHLRPFIKDDVVRVGGRLVNANLTFEEQHPILLPKRDHLVELIIDHYHRNNLHTGPHLVLSLLRMRYWILSARTVVRSQIQKCNTCFRLNPKSQIPVMGNLPMSRIQQAKPFLRTGCDYAGPVHIVPEHRRGIRPIKAYICLFVCMVTKALHLELVTSLSTESFLQAFKRFIGRRGAVSEIHSDNGTNFVGAKTILNDFYQFVVSSEYNETMANELANRGIQWRLIPPGAPHIGGLWEANVRSMKTHLYKVIKNRLLSQEEFNTLLVQIESLLNSRPLCVLSSDPADPIALTPSHFLTLTPLTHFPVSDLTDQPLSRLDRFQMIDRMVQDYWKRWHIEYLTTLQSRQRWNSDSNPIKLGTVVVLEQPNASPLHWPLGIIDKLYPGSDNIVRVVDVRTKHGVYRRPVVKVCPLPLQ